jgi:FkbM family methyltransferase
LTNYFETPILFLVFNRPSTTIKVFRKIREIKPKHLFVAADGPRINKPDDFEKCKEVRSIISSGIDWECEIHKLYREDNLGCGLAVSGAINWFFEQVEEGIILEDDTLPDISFFKFCEILLEKYRDNNTVMHISGCNFLKNYVRGISNDDSYYFTKHIHVWGWATWKSSWNKYDFSMKNYMEKRKSLYKYFGKYAAFWDNKFLEIFQKNINTWDYQWMYAIFINKGIAVNPSMNLIQNIGFNEDATHTKNPDSIYNSIAAESFSKVRHPFRIKVNAKKDEFYYQNFLNVKFKNSSILSKAGYKLAGILNKIFKKSRTENNLSQKEYFRLNNLPRYQSTETIFFGNKFRIPDASTFLSSYHEIFQQEVYRFNTSHQKPIIVDCGANIGLATIYFKELYQNAIVYAFEPDVDLYEAMCFNISSFGLTNVKCLNNAVSINNSELLFHKEGGHSGMLVNENGKNVVRVKTKRLKEFLAQFEYISFLKIDIEGHEDKVIIDIKNELSKVEFLFLEYHSFIGKEQVLGEILAILKEAGFRYYLKESYNKKFPFIQKEIFLEMDLLLNIYCYRN